MPAASTEMQKTFAVEYASNGGNATAAAKAAGYSEKSSHEIGRQLLQKPHVLEMIRTHLAKLRSRSGAVGLHALVEICTNSESPANARVAAARALCEHAGMMGTGKDLEALKDAEAREAGEHVSAREVLAAFTRNRAGAAERRQ